MAGANGQNKARARTSAARTQRQPSCRPHRRARLDRAAISRLRDRHRRLPSLSSANPLPDFASTRTSTSSPRSSRLMLSLRHPNRVLCLAPLHPVSAKTARVALAPHHELLQQPHFARLRTLRAPTASQKRPVTSRHPERTADKAHSPHPSRGGGGAGPRNGFLQRTAVRRCGLARRYSAHALERRKRLSISIHCTAMRACSPILGSRARTPQTSIHYADIGIRLIYFVGLFLFRNEMVPPESSVGNCWATPASCLITGGTIETATSAENDMAPLRRQLEGALEKAASLNIKGLSGSCANILEHREALWTFVERDDVEPTNNHAERELRAFVGYGSLCITSSSAWNLQRSVVATGATRMLAA